MIFDKLKAKPLNGELKLAAVENQSWLQSLVDWGKDKIPFYSEWEDANADSNSLLFTAMLAFNSKPMSRTSEL
jgi:hypothetical protein